MYNQIMNISYNIAEINKILSDLSVITGMTLGFWTNRKELIAVQPESHNPFCYAIRQTSEGARRCACSDARLIEKCLTEKCRVTHICHAGLPDSFMPLYYNDILIGFLSFGQISDRHTGLPDGEIKKRLEGLPVDIDKMIYEYKNLPRYSEEKIEAVTQVATACMQFVLLKKSIFMLGNSTMEKITEWIEQNLSSKISYETICDKFYVSQSTLYYLFNKTYNCTVHQYINSRRLEKARELLRDSNKSITDIAFSVGFFSQNYFTRLFKKEHGISPAKYRKSGFKEKKEN